MRQRRPRLIQFAAAALAVDAVASLALAAAGPALVQRAPPALPPFPETRSAPAVATWLRRNSDLSLATVVGIGADSVFAVDHDPAALPTQGVRAVIRQEAITPDFAKRLGGRSATMTVDIDCAGHRVFQRAVDLYTGSNRQGPSRQLGAAKDWQAIPPGTFMERVMVAVCDPAWRPLYGDSQSARVAAVPAPQPVPVPPTPRPSPAPVYPQAPLPYPVQAEAAPPAAYAPPLQTILPQAAPPVVSSRGARAELGRFDSADAALSFWRAADLASTGKRLRLEIAVVGGRNQYRAVVEGFSGHADAVAFCRLVADLGGPCVVVD